MDLKNLTEIVTLSGNLDKVNAALAIMNDRYSGELDFSITIDSDRGKSASANIDRTAMATILATEKTRLEKRLTDLGVKV